MMEIFGGLVYFIQRTGRSCPGAPSLLEIAEKSRFSRSGQGGLAIHETEGAFGWCFVSHSNRQETFHMSKTAKSLLAGAAFAGVVAATGAAVNASTLLPSLKSSLSAQDKDASQSKNADDKQEHAN